MRINLTASTQVTVFLGSSVMEFPPVHVWQSKFDLKYLNLHKFG